MLAVALVAPGGNFSAEGGTSKRGDASALARVRWPEGAKAEAWGDSCEPHPFPTCIDPVSSAFSCGGRSGEWALQGRACGVCGILGDLVPGKERTVPKILGNQMLRLSGVLVLFIQFIDSCCMCVLSTCCVFCCFLGSETGVQGVRDSVPLGSGDAGFAVHIIERAWLLHTCSRKAEYCCEFETGLGYVAKPCFKTTEHSSKNRPCGALEKQRQEDCCEFHTSLGRPDPASKATDKPRVYLNSGDGDWGTVRSTRGLISQKNKKQGKLFHERRAA